MDEYGLNDALTDLSMLERSLTDDEKVAALVRIRTFLKVQAAIITDTRRAGVVIESPF